MEFDRGSRMAQSLRPGQRPRAASIVALTAVGWCAKSSTTTIPPISPFTSMRRFTLRNVARPLAISSAPLQRPSATINGEIARDPIIFRSESIRGDRTESLLCCTAQSRARIFAIAPDHHAPSSRNKVHQPAEGQLVGLKIGVDVRVVVLERGNNQVVGMVMKKLGSAVPEGRLVFVSFEDEFHPAAKAVTLAKILRHAADEKVRPLPRRLEKPCQHCGGRRFAMCSTDDDGMLSRQKHFFENLRHRAVRNAPI